MTQSWNPAIDRQVERDWEVRTGQRAPCPKCNPSNPELDETGRPYTCYFCCDTGRVDQATADAYWQELTDECEYRGLRHVVGGKHQFHHYDRESGDVWTTVRPLLPAILFARQPGRNQRAVICADFDPLDIDADIPF